MIRTVVLVLLSAIVCSATVRRQHHPYHWYNDDDEYYDHHVQHHHHRSPSFLKGLSADTKKEYYNILRKANETVAQQKQEILAWAAKHNLTDKVKKFDDDLKKHQMEVKKNVTDVLTALPKIHEQFLKIVEDENQTHNQMRHKIEELARNHTKEFDALMYISTHLHVHHRHHHKRHVKKHHKKHST
ncbi:unnamed protein product [Cylicostephanus goldi]|uniref:SXP/RAL-2 family protein Ani s 5-like cation-binding domain-containing protein n=1 Tax=Cylicostephanus goldi TaxID=71465 RepID=A0A3P6RN00_CYLGO|nr:unnamed protein product [Cylicostephanus goldi]